MTQEEFLDKYGRIKVKFRSYCKYSFTFEDEDGEGLVVSIGGSADDIYRFSVNNAPVDVADLWPNWGRCGEDTFEARW